MVPLKKKKTQDSEWAHIDSEFDAQRASLSRGLRGSASLLESGFLQSKGAIDVQLEQSVRLLKGSVGGRRGRGEGGGWCFFARGGAGRTVRMPPRRCPNLSPESSSPRSSSSCRSRGTLVTIAQARVGGVGVGWGGSGEGGGGGLCA